MTTFRKILVATHSMGFRGNIMRKFSPLLTLAIFTPLLIILASVVIAQNPSAENSEPNWDSPRTRELTKRACFDCHSNEVNWPWYSNLPIVGDLVRKDVEEGREDLNFSEWGLREQEEADEAVETIEDNSMPPEIYLTWHPEARLSESEKLELIQGLQKTLGIGNGEENEEEDDDDDD